MKESHLFLKVIILFIFLFLFSATSLALIPGDFGSADNGPPDGVIDFEDLMIFAMAYSSSSGDYNWNPNCDIAGPNGSTSPDGVIDFEDLMIFAMNYGRRDKVTGVKAIAINIPYSLEPVWPTPASSMIGFEDRTNKIGEKSLILQNIKFDKLKGKEGDSYYAVFIYWDAYYQNRSTENINYKIYRSTDGINYNNINIYDGSSYIFEEYFEGEECTICGFIDTDVDPESGNTYSYYITACGSDWETNPSQTVSIDTWLPLCCTLVSPVDQSIITDPNPTFTWDPVDVASFPYGSICSGESDLWIWDSNESAQVWYIIFNNLTTSTAIYNQDGQATPLVPGHGYYWNSWSYGYNLEGDLIAISFCEARSFGYKITEGVVSDVNATAVTTEWGYHIDLTYNSYYGATSYKNYRSVNGGDYELLPNYLYREFPPDNNWHNLEGWGYSTSPPPFCDDDVTPDNTYSYYVIACGDGWETAPSEIVTIDTWLPPCSLISPHDNSAISDPNPTFTWNPGVSSLPYGSIYSGKSHFFVHDQTDLFRSWSIYLDDITTSSATYNQDGQADPLVAGHDYTWGSNIYGYDENGDLIAVSVSERWGFGYLVEDGIVNGVYAIAITNQLSMSKFEDKMEQLEEEDKLPSGYFFNEITELKEGFTNYAIRIGWHNYYGASGLKGYRVYRSINGAGYTLVCDCGSPFGYDYSVYDNDVSTDNVYAYYVTAYGDGWESDFSQIVTINTWLPLCVLTSPPNDSVISESNPTFTWDTEISNLPYGSIYSGESNLSVYDKFTEWSRGQVWQFSFNDLTTSTATYNQDNQATPLVSGHSYCWNLEAYGYDENDHLIALSYCEFWNFDYLEN